MRQDHLYNSISKLSNNFDSDINTITLLQICHIIKILSCYIIATILTQCYRTILNDLERLSFRAKLLGEKHGLAFRCYLELSTIKTSQIACKENWTVLGPKI